MHPVLDYLDEWVDPFTVFAIELQRDLTFETFPTPCGYAYKSEI